MTNETTPHKLFSNGSYLIQASPSDIRCETFTLDPQLIIDHNAPKGSKGYRQELTLTVTYTIDGDSLTITRK